MIWDVGGDRFGGCSACVSAGVVVIWERCRVDLIEVHHGVV